MSLTVNQFSGFGDLYSHLVMQASSTSTATTITAPAEIVVGDLLVLFDNAQSASVPTSVVPTDFTQIVTTNDGSFGRNICSYKIAVGTEGGSSITGMAGTTVRKALIVFRRGGGIKSVAIGSAAGQLTSGNPTAQVVSSSAGVAPLIVFAAYSSASSGSAVDPRSFTPAKDGEVNANTFQYLAYKIYTSDPVDVTVDMDDEGNLNGLQSFYLAVS